MTALDLVKLHRDGVTVEAVRLTPGNFNAVLEWADSKPYFGQRPDANSPMPITGLTIFTRGGRRTATFEDWVIRNADGTWTCCSDVNLERGYGQPVGETSVEVAEPPAWSPKAVTA